MASHWHTDGIDDLFAFMGEVQARYGDDTAEKIDKLLQNEMTRKQMLRLVPPLTVCYVLA